MARLHIANGDSTTALIRRAGIDGDLSIWADALYEGPVPGGISDEALRAVRAGYLAGAESGAEYERVLAVLSMWESALENAEQYEEVVLWYEHDLFDQLNLIQLLGRLRALPSVRLICIGSFPGKPALKGLGELLPGELSTLWADRQPVVEEQYALARRAWEAFGAATPAPLETLLQEDFMALPFLGPALRRHLQEFPWVGHGLSRTEARVLEIALESPVEIGEAFKKLHESETCFYVGDISFWRVVRELDGLGFARIHTSEAEPPGALEPGSHAGPSSRLSSVGVPSITKSIA